MGAADAADICAMCAATCFGVSVTVVGGANSVAGCPVQLTSWAGLTPRHRESDKTVHRGRITKQGSKLVRWAAIEAVQRGGADNPIGAYRERVAERRGRNQAKVAAARVLCECVFYALRDHHVRRLVPKTVAEPARVA